MKPWQIYGALVGALVSVYIEAGVELQLADGEIVTDSYVEVSAQAEFDVVYDVSLPPDAPDGMTFKAHYFFINGRYIAKRNTLPDAAGLGWRITHPQALGLYVGEKEELEICIGDISRIEDQPLQYCHKVVIRARVDAASLASRYVDALSLQDGQDYSGCSSAYSCHFYQDIFYGSEAPWINSYRTEPDFPGAKGEPAAAHVNHLSFDFYYPNAAGAGTIDATAPKTLIVIGHSASKSKESIRVGPASIVKFLQANNYAVAAPDFRHPLKELDENDNPIASKDMAKLVQFFKHYGAEFNIDPERIILTGNSLGGGVAVNSAFGDVQQLSSIDPVLRESSQVAGVWVLDSATAFSPNWVRETYLEAPAPDTLPQDNAHLCYYPDLDDGGNYHKYGFAIGNVGADSADIGLYYLTHPADLSAGKLAVDDILFCPTPTSSGSYDLIHLANFGESMQQAYIAAGIGDRVTLGFGKTINDYYFDLVPFVNGLAP